MCQAWEVVATEVVVSLFEFYGDWTSYRGPAKLLSKMTHIEPHTRILSTSYFTESPVEQYAPAVSHLQNLNFLCVPKPWLLNSANLQNLHSISFTTIYPHANQLGFLKQLPTLKSLAWHQQYPEMGRYEHEDVLRGIFQSLPRVTHLRVSGFHKALHHLTALKKLIVITRLVKIYDDADKANLCLLTNLTSLSVSGTSMSWDLVSKLPKLKTLRFQPLPSPRAPPMTTLLKLELRCAEPVDLSQLSNLKILKLRSCIIFFNNFAELPNLEHLILVGTVLPFPSLLKLKRLKMLTINADSAIDEETRSVLKLPAKEFDFWEPPSRTSS